MLLYHTHRTLNSDFVVFLRNWQVKYCGNAGRAHKSVYDGEVPETGIYLMYAYETAAPLRWNYTIIRQSNIQVCAVANGPARDALRHAIVLYTKVDARCDKLARSSVEFSSAKLFR